MKVFIIGGTGFIGYHATLEFLQRGHETVAGKGEEAGQRDNLAGVFQGKQGNDHKNNDASESQ